jgi:hypothetical protein
MLRFKLIPLLFVLGCTLFAKPVYIDYNKEILPLVKKMQPLGLYQAQPKLVYHRTEETNIYSNFPIYNRKGYYIDTPIYTTMTMKDKDGKVYWRKQLPTFRPIGPSKDNNISSDLFPAGTIVNDAGTVLRKDQKRKCLYLYGKDKSSIYLPEGTAELKSLGFYGNKYWYLTTPNINIGDDYDHNQRYGDSLFTSVIESGKGLAVYKADGSKLAYLDMSACGKNPQVISISPDGEKFVYTFTKADSSWGFALYRLSDKRVIPITDMVNVTCDWSAAGDLLTYMKTAREIKDRSDPNYPVEIQREILNPEKGEVSYIVTGNSSWFWNPGISNADAHLVLLAYGYWARDRKDYVHDKCIIYDYQNKTIVDVIDMREVKDYYSYHISGDGRQITIFANDWEQKYIRK